MMEAGTERVTARIFGKSWGSTSPSYMLTKSDFDDSKKKDQSLIDKID